MAEVDENLDLLEAGLVIQRITPALRRQRWKNHGLKLHPKLCGKSPLKKPKEVDRTEKSWSELDCPKKAA